MREFNFRIWRWDGTDTFWYSDSSTYIGLESKPQEFQLFSKLSFGFHLPISNKTTGQAVIQQSTGLRDKIGEIIYEGDILKRNWNQCEYLYQVQWYNGVTMSIGGEYSCVLTGFGVKCIKSSDSNWQADVGRDFYLGNKHLYEDCGIFGEVAEDLEIIGNIYENADILH